MTDKEKWFKETYGELTDEELESYGAAIFRLVKEAEDKEKEKDDGRDSESTKEKQIP